MNPLQEQAERVDADGGADRRVRLRHAVHVEAVITVPGMAGRACFIRDLGRGGMYLDLRSELGHRPEVELLPGMQVAIAFSVDIDGRRVRTAARGRIAHVQPGGIGVRLTGADEPLLAAMRALVSEASAARARAAALGLIGADADRGEPQAMLRDLERALAPYAARLVSTLLRHASRQLARLCAETGSAAERARLELSSTNFDQSLAHVGTMLERDLIESFRATLGTAALPVVSAQAQELALMETNDLADVIALGQVIDGMERDLAAGTFEFDQRLGLLLGRAVDRHNSALSPESICRTLCDSLLARFPPLPLRVLTQGALAQEWTRALAELYRDLNALMTARGVPTGITAPARTD